MEPRLLEYFVAVINHGGVTRAAEALFVAQPSLSQAIRTLERRVGAELFTRQGRGLVLTEEGRRLEVSARRVLDEVSAAREQVEMVRRVESGTLRISATADLTLSPLPRWVATFTERHPGVGVHVLDPGTASEVVADVRQGRADVGFTTLPVRTDALTVVPLRRQHLVLVLDEATASVLPDPVPQVVLGTLDMVREIDDHLEDLVVDRSVLAARPGLVRTAHRPLLWELVMAGVGAAVLPAGLAHRHLSGVVERGMDPSLTREVALVHRSDHLVPAAVALLAVIDELSGSNGFEAAR